ncbi:MAG: DNA mismatch repair endonuclease MutL [Oscillospiraceae bacterium]
MPKINLLDKSVYELIAAGEVIERPASVIKELAENSIDAGAKTVTVEIKRGGITYIRVSDDGCGIAYEDIPTAFLRHATSKVYSADDLENINTLGFRGEALASVCAVGRVQLTSKRPEDKLGTSYRIEGGEVVEYDRTGCADGTTIIIRDLFFNTPARLKFLKKDVTEGNYCAAVVEKLALSHPDISFRLIRDGKQTMITGGDGEYYSAVYSVFGKQFAAGLVPVENIYRDISVVGYVSSPLATRKNRSMQHFFVNGRSVKSPLCSAAIEEAFRNTIMVGKFPACVLCINIDPSQLDANISPAKTEVRFSNEKAVFDAIYFAVKNGLLGFDESREIQLPNAADKAPEEPQEPARAKAPENGRVSTMAIPSGRETVLYPQGKSAPEKLPLRQEYQNAEQQVMEEVVPPLLKRTEPPEPPLESFPGFAFLSQKSFEKKPEKTEQPRTSTADIIARMRAESGENSTQTKPLPEIPAPEKPQETALSAGDILPKSPAPEAEREPENQFPPKAPEQPSAEEFPEAPRTQVRVVGELFKTYIICESSEGMILIDKHAAHERINFENFKRGVNMHGQLLLEPVEVTLAPEEYEAVSSFAAKLADVGILLKFPEGGKVLVEGMPQALDSTDPAELVESIAQLLASGNDNAEGALFDDVLHTMACKASIRGNEKTDITELAALADRVLNDRAIRYCPHGRPVLTQISRSQLERYFSRQV